MRYTAFDVETPNYANDRMSAIGLVVIEDRKIVHRFYSLVQPECEFDAFNIELTGITPGMVEGAPTFAQLWPVLRPYMTDTVLVAHNAQFDMAVLAKCLRDYGIVWQDTAEYICTCRLGKHLLPQLPNHRLDTLCAHYALDLQHHQADSDALACAEIFCRFWDAKWESQYRRIYDLHRIKTLPLGKSKGA